MKNDVVILRIEMERPTCNMCPFAQESYTECMFLDGDETLPNNEVAHRDCPFNNANTVRMVKRQGYSFTIYEKE